MITRFRIFESENLEPKIGDYVIIGKIKNWEKFPHKKLQNEIGIIIDIDSKTDYRVYIVKFSTREWYFFKEDIIYSSNKDDVKAILKAKKYNL